MHAIKIPRETREIRMPPPTRQPCQAIFRRLPSYDGRRRPPRALDDEFESLYNIALDFDGVVGVRRRCAARE